MKLERLTPILNVSNIGESFAWFAKLGWTKKWDWGEPPTFGAVGNDDIVIFLCRGAQGSRGVPIPPDAEDDEGSGGVWMSWWLGSPAEVNAAHELAVREGMTVTWPPTCLPRTG